MHRFFFHCHLAKLFIRSAYRQPSLQRMMRLCFLAIFIATGSLTLITIIMQGFARATYQALQTIHPDIIMSAHGNALNMAAIEPILHKEFPGIAYSPVSSHHALVQATVGTPLEHVIMIHGINPPMHAKTTALQKKIKPSKYGVMLSDIIQKNRIIIGKELAHCLHVNVGSSVTLLIPTLTSNHTIHLTPYPVIIGALLDSGIEDIDTTIIFCHKDFFELLFSDHEGITELYYAVPPHINRATLVTALKKRFDLDVYSWQELYPALIAALHMDTIIMVIIFSLIVVIASMTLIALLCMLIMQKKGDIALLQSMGMTHRSLQTIFIIMGTLIGTCASIVGMSVAAIVAWLIKYYFPIRLPDAYYTTQLPVALESSIFITIFIGTFILSCATSWWATKKNTFFSLAHILRFEV